MINDLLTKEIHENVVISRLIGFRRRLKGLNKIISYFKRVKTLILKVQRLFSKIITYIQGDI